MLIATRMAMLNATMNKKNFPTAVPPADHNAEREEWFLGTGDACVGTEKRARRCGGPFDVSLCEGSQIATP